MADGNAELMAMAMAKANFGPRQEPEWVGGLIDCGHKY
jgi:hypothetical protein